MEKVMTMPFAVDPHVHLRFKQSMLSMAVTQAVKHYRHVTAMPNFGPDRIRTPQQSLAYAWRVLEIARPLSPKFSVNVPLYLEPDTDPDVVQEGFEQGAWIDAKLYPRNGTTASAEGVDFNDLKLLAPVFKRMERLGMRLRIHAERQSDTYNAPIDAWEREPATRKDIEWILDAFPELWVSIEHVTKAQMANQVEIWFGQGRRVMASVAPQYLTWNRNALFDRGMNPAKYSIPILGTEADRMALVKFVTRGECVFLGTDSAPHPYSCKSKPEGCSGGVYNHPTALLDYAAIFQESGVSQWRERFINFACYRPARFLGLPIDEEHTEHRLAIVSREWIVPDTCGEDRVIPMHAGKKMWFDVVPI